MILSHHWIMGSIKDGTLKPATYLVQGCDDSTSKSTEFYWMWYTYLRTFCPHEPLYIVDNASPTPISHFTDRLKEPFEVIDDVNCFSLDPTKTVHIKRYTDPLNHQLGSVRQNQDFVKLCLANRFDYNQIESDLLLAYDPFDDFKDRDFATYEILPSLRSCYTLCVTHIGLSNLREALKRGLSKEVSSTHDAAGDFTEARYYNLFCHGKTSSLTRRDKISHKRTAGEILSFLKANPITDPAYIEFRDLLESRGPYPTPTPVRLSSPVKRHSAIAAVSSPASSGVPVRLTPLARKLITQVNQLEILVLALDTQLSVNVTASSRAMRLFLRRVVKETGVVFDSIKLGPVPEPDIV